MTQKEKKLKAIIELATVEARINELERSKTYLTSSTFYRNRLRVLNEKAEQLRDIIEGREAQEVRLVFHVPEVLFKGNEKPENILQYMKKEFLVLE